MGSSQYSFMDIVVLDEIRSRFADGDALVVLSADLGEVLWANGPGARLFGYRDIGSIIGAPPKMGLPAERQISSTPGYPHIGRDRSIAVRITNGFTSHVVRPLASCIAMPDGERAILLAVPASEGPSADAGVRAKRAIEGFGGEGQFTALVDGEGKIVAASPDFASLAIGEATLLGLIREVQGPERLAKRRIPVRTLMMPAGMARLTDEPATHLIVVVDDSEEAEEPRTEAADTQAPEPGSTPAATEPLEAADPADEATAAEDKPTTSGDAPAAEKATEDKAVQHGSVDRWYFLHDEENKREPEAAPVVDQSGEPAAEPAATMSPPRQADLGTTPVKFVWRTGADGCFTSISDEFAAALGDASADIVGRPFVEVAQAFGFDTDGEIAGLLERRDTWSGRSVLWPVIGADMRVPVDLAALPIYGRDRNFEGFRGFGVARTADAVAAPAPEPAASQAEEAAAGGGKPPSPEINEDEAAAPAAEETAKEKADPFQGEIPALAIVPKPERRYSDKIIRLAEHRPAAPTEDGLSQTERNAFREIGARLRKDSEKRRDAEQPHEAPEKSVAEKETDADKVLPIVRESFGKRDWLKFSEPQTGQSGADTEDAPTSAEASSTPDDAEAAEKAGAPESLPPESPPGEAGDTVSTMEAANTDAEDMPIPSDAAMDDGVKTTVAGDETGTSGDSSQRTTKASEETDATEDGAPAKEQKAAVEQEPVIPSAFVSPDFVAEEAAAQPRLYQAILSKLPTPVLVHSGDELHYANDEFLRLTGYPSLEAIRSAGGLGELFADPYDAEGEAGGRKLCLRTASGDTRPVEALLQSVPWKSGKALMLALRPVAQPAEQETSAEIRQFPLPQTASETKSDAETKSSPEARVEELRAIIDTATDGVVLISPEGTIRSISRPAEALFGFDSDEVAGKQFAALFAIESQRAAQDYLNGLSDNGVASVLNDGREVIGREAQGRFIPLFMTIGRLPGDNGFCAVLRDVTQWKRAEEELTQARSQAEVASSQKTEFLARVSHEIRTPLNAIIGFSELMIDEKFGPVGNDRYRDYLRDINRSGSHVLDLVNDLLDISKIEAGEQEMNYEAVSLNDTLAETVAMMQPQANRERVIIRSSFPSRLPEVVADLRSVRQIALNLLSNAVRYTQAGGQVIVSTSYETNGDIVMRVRDTGVGMSQPEIEQAMKPFKQVNTLRRPRGDGTGLGLPLTKAMVEANRARFSISSTPGAGTLVEVTFPSTRVLAD
ncbi:PAS domain S-box protein [Mesorhizobium koreense]|uniref:PAS domain S-box protein n=1 Tax=Mesorhizobium koreense TaxID=3074855 RepID=UPI00287BB979|nr:PAS domain S-box protein [Mesorhizobium sp. WR6]